MKEEFWVGKMIRYQGPSKASIVYLTMTKDEWDIWDMEDCGHVNIQLNPNLVFLIIADRAHTPWAHSGKSKYYTGESEFLCLHEDKMFNMIVTKTANGVVDRLVEWDLVNL